MPRSIRVAPECIPQVKQALRRHRFPNQKALAQTLGLCLSTVHGYLNGKKIDYINFVEISERLGLDWQAIAYLEEEPPIQIEPQSPSETPPEQEQAAQVNQPLKRHGFPDYSQKALAHELGLSRATISSFFNGKKIDYINFVEISERLGLDWQAIADKEDPAEGQNEGLQINALVQKVRQHCHDKIQTLYGKMQLLDISQPVDIDNFYVDVNILEQISSQQWLEISDLLQGFNPESDDFDRLGMSRVLQERLPGLEAVQKYPRLMVLGKPGSGKTTFLQHLAIQCNQGKFQADQVPIFIRLKNFAKYARDEGNFRFLNYISREFRSCGISQPEVTEALLNHGRGMILLDGLDEVPSEDESKVIEQIEQLSQDYFKNQLIITCRIAASKYRFPGFTEVEVADFNQQQIKSFAEKWFIAFARNDREEGSALALQFAEKLNRRENKQIRELAVTPILLHLTCLVFQAKAKFPSNRAKLYEQGLNILLKRWDEARGIQRDEVYRDLDVEHKKELLNQVAAITFERGDYLFEQDKIQQLIADYLATLPDAKTDRLTWQRNSEAVLKAIEAQHGLLIERARGIYSFSHLTFQEYFTAKYFVDSSVGAYCNTPLQQLVSHITEKRWREVFLLAVGMCKNADCLLQLMKQQIDGLVAADENLQQFLMWVSQKSVSVEVPYKPAAVRAFYFAVAFGRELAVSRDLDFYGVRDLARALNLDLYYTDNFDIIVDLNLGRILSRAHDLTHPQHALASYLQFDFNHPFSPRDFDFNHPFTRILDLELDLEFKQALQHHKIQLPSRSEQERVKQWWQANGHTWTEQLRSLMIKHRNIGHDWLFSTQQKELLKQYYDANKLLVDCLNSGCNVTPAVREEIEETLLLPIAQIEKRRSCFDK